MIESVRIGTTNWSKKNLDVSNYANGDTIRQITNIKDWVSAKEGAWCWYNFDESYKEYGKYYNTYAVNDSRGLAPNGWHIPTLRDFYNLAYYANMASSFKIFCEKGTQHWNTDFGTDVYGFSLLGGGGITNYEGAVLVKSQSSVQPNSVVIGKQKWTTDNLNQVVFMNGDAIPLASNQTEWNNYANNKTPCYAFRNFDAANYNDGLFYNVYALKDSRGLGFTGWRIPKKEDINILRDFVNAQYPEGQYALKSKTTWVLANGTDKIGFNAKAIGNSMTTGYGYYSAFALSDDDFLESYFSFEPNWNNAWFYYHDEYPELAGFNVRLIKETEFGGEGIKQVAYLYFDKENNIDNTLIKALADVGYYLPIENGTAGNWYLQISDGDKYNYLVNTSSNDAWMGYNVRIVKDKQVYSNFVENIEKESLLKSIAFSSVIGGLIYIASTKLFNQSAKNSLAVSIGFAGLYLIYRQKTIKITPPPAPPVVPLTLAPTPIQTPETNRIYRIYTSRMSSTEPTKTEPVKTESAKIVKLEDLQDCDFPLRIGINNCKKVWLLQSLLNSFEQRFPNKPLVQDGNFDSKTEQALEFIFGKKTIDTDFEFDELIQMQWVEQLDLRGDTVTDAQGKDTVVGGTDNNWAYLGNPFAILGGLKRKNNETIY